jgi:flagellar protein FlaG
MVYGYRPFWPYHKGGYMDTLKAVSVHPSQGSGSVHAPTKKNEEPGVTVSAVTTAKALIPAKLPEQKDQENQQQFSNAVKEISNFFQMAQSSLEFSLDDVSGQMIMQIKDTETNEVIRQIPSEDVLTLAKRLDDLTGVLFKASA